MNITAIVLTHNESLHLARCLRSLESVVDRILVVDSYSTDNTGDIALSFGATLVKHEWTNYATQFNWALTQLSPDTEWVLRIDADEFLTAELISELNSMTPTAIQGVAGIYCGRRMTFQGQLIRFGGVFPIRVLRLFRFGNGRCENRWMDEHIKITGETLGIRGEIIDDNLNSLTWWTEKHNRYASREAVDLLNLEFHFAPRDSVSSLADAGQPGLKRWLKEELYYRLPTGVRAFAYFFYRYFLRFGFLDGSRGGAFHILQALWYRYLVDVKVEEVKRRMKSDGIDIRTAIEQILGIKV